GQHKCTSRKTVGGFGTWPANRVSQSPLAAASRIRLKISSRDSDIEAAGADERANKHSFKHTSAMRVKKNGNLPAAKRTYYLSKLLG
ncbi:MAG: hypothetical protein J2P49_08050, partial [Methylocapsa sp.]|nr:hypothetical protein [Methylocapsa sp.]